jgi:DNA-binding response OmpR family regulator
LRRRAGLIYAPGAWKWGGHYGASEASAGGIGRARILVVPRFLLVEDNEDLANLVAQGLRRSDFVVDRAASISEADEILASNKYGAIILDLGLPDGDASGLIRALRAREDSTPILVVTARGNVRDRVEGLNAGADDYLVKPFSFEELLARLRALLRRPGEFLGRLLQVGNVTYDTVAQQGFVNGNPIILSAREAAVLDIMMRRHGRVVQKSSVEDQLYGLSEEVRSNAVEVHMHRLRKRLADAGATASIHTVRGLGYLMRET